MTKGRKKAYWRRQARRKMNNSDAIGHNKMAGDVVRRGYGSIIPDGRPVNYFTIGQEDPFNPSPEGEAYGEAVYRALVSA